MGRAQARLDRAGHAELRADVLGRAAVARGQGLFRPLLRAGAAKGVQSSVSLLYYDYVHWYAKAIEAGRHDGPRQGRRRRSRR